MLVCPYCGGEVIVYPPDEDRVIQKELPHYCLQCNRRLKRSECKVDNSRVSMLSHSNKTDGDKV